MKQSENKERYIRLAHFVIKNITMGMLQGFGAVIGASVMVVILLWFLRRIEFLPYLGKYIAQIVDIVQSNSKSTH